MTRTEHDLRTIYRDQPDLVEAQSRLQDWAASQTATAPPTRAGLRSWAAPLASAAAVAAVTTALVTLPHWHDSHTRSAATARPAGGATVSASVPAVNPRASWSAPQAIPPTMVTITPQFAAQHLIDLLPHAGKITDLTGTAVSYGVAY
jgi:hypothetical protein